MRVSSSANGGLAGASRLVHYHVRVGLLVRHDAQSLGAPRMRCDSRVFAHACNAIERGRLAPLEMAYNHVKNNLLGWGDGREGGIMNVTEARRGGVAIALL